MSTLCDRQFSQFSKLRLKKLALRKKSIHPHPSSTAKPMAFVSNAIGQGTTLALSNPSSH